MEAILSQLLVDTAEVDRADFQSLGCRLQTPAGTVLYGPSDVPRGLTVLFSGRIAVENRGERVVEFGKGSYFGERTLMADEPAGVSLVVIEDVDGMEFPREAARQFLTVRPHFGYAVLKALFSGNLARLSATNRAFVEVKSLARELEIRNRELSESVQKLAAIQSELLHAQHLAAVGTLVAGVAHEINNPLAYVSQSITTALERAKERPAGDRLIKPLERALEGTDRIRHIVDDLRVIGRQERMQAVHCDVQQELDATLLMLSPVARDRSVTLAYTSAPAGTVLLPPTKLFQVLNNLIHNAIDATPPGGTVHLETERLTDRVVIRVRDAGAGIPPAVRPQIFDPFFTTKPAGQGTGLGLWITNTIVLAAGGTIEVDSQVNMGTTFVISLPASA